MGKNPLAWVSFPPAVSDIIICDSAIKNLKNFLPYRERAKLLLISFTNFETT
jgi:hypothetical protein